VLGSHLFELSAIALYGLNLMLLTLQNVLRCFYTVQRPEVASKDFYTQLERK
jgi:hypothetical protein